ncbi:hypothetical protein GCM10010402_21100 [Actinomadura luteofluorescens]|nr:hypothetical protein [Actinomadura glauciflava]
MGGRARSTRGPLPRRLWQKRGPAVGGLKDTTHSKDGTRTALDRTSEAPALIHVAPTMT